MRTKEFKSHIKSMKMVTYRSTYDSQDFYDVQCDGYTVASVSLSSMGNLRFWPRFFRLNTSVQSELMDHLLGYAKTPVKDRREHRWNVIVGRNKFGENSGPVAYFKRDDPLDIELSYAGSVEVLSNEWYVFSDNEFSNLVACLKKQPDGDRLAKIAELGKVPAPEVEK